MASPRQHGDRLYASPARRTGRPRYYYNTTRGSFYSLPTRRVRAQRLDVLDLMEIGETRRDFRVTKSGEVRFRGQALTSKTVPPLRAWNVLKHPKPYARLRARRKSRPGVDVPPTIRSYLEAVASRSPTYVLTQVIASAADHDPSVTEYTGIFVSTTRGTAFAVTTS